MYGWPTKKDYDELVESWYTVAVEARKLEKELVSSKKVLDAARRNKEETKTLKEQIVQARMRLEDLHIRERSLARKVLVFLVVRDTANS